MQLSAAAHCDDPRHFHQIPTTKNVLLKKTKCMNFRSGPRSLINSYEATLFWGSSSKQRSSLFIPLVDLAREDLNHKMRVKES